MVSLGFAELDKAVLSCVLRKGDMLLVSWVQARPEILRRVEESACIRAPNVVGNVVGLD